MCNHNTEMELQQVTVSKVIQRWRPWLTNNLPELHKALQHLYLYLLFSRCNQQCDASPTEAQNVVRAYTSYLKTKVLIQYTNKP